MKNQIIIAKLSLWLSLVSFLMVFALLVFSMGCNKEYEDPRHITGRLVLIHTTAHSQLYEYLDENYILVDTNNNTIITSVNEYRVNLGGSGWFISNEAQPSMVVSNCFVKQFIDSILTYGFPPQIKPMENIKPNGFYLVKDGINGIQQISDSINSGKLFSIAEQVY